MTMERVDLNDPELQDAVVELSDETTRSGHDTPCTFTTGIAGSGKSFLWRKRVEEDASAAMLCATTGIAAVNMGTTTFWSALGLHPDSIEDQFISGRMRQRMHQIALTHRKLGIDEASMLSGLVLDMLYQTAEQVNEYADVKEPFGLLLIGDMCQLPPIKAPWIFTAECWSKFEQGTERLDTNWRQGAGAFLDGLNALRRGDGPAGAAILKPIVKWERELNPRFDGTVILGKNKQVDNYNQLRFMKMPGQSMPYKAWRWGKQRSEWDNIPEQLQLKDQTYVLVLSNDTEKGLDGRSMFRWVNGDTGRVVTCGPNSVTVKLTRTGEEHEITSVRREVLSRETPSEFDADECERAKETQKELADGSYWDARKKRWIRGAITYLPLRLGYATSVHKSQGTSIGGPVMIDVREPFLNEPTMIYVSLSRATKGENLHIVGDEAMLARRCRIDERTRPWL